MPTLLEEDEISARLPTLAPWGREGSALVAEFRFADFSAAMAFVNRVADAAEKANHHPDITIRWNRVSLTLSTHSAGGLTDKDFTLAQEISARA